jgi:hypothetical protein
MKHMHLRLSPDSSKTFCRIEATSHSFTESANAVEDPIKADCVKCLGEAVAFHEMHAKIAEDRLEVLAGQRPSHQGSE